jgi:hypothetical protein
MSVNAYVEYCQEKATQLNQRVPVIVRAAGTYVSKAEIKKMLPGNVRFFVEKDQPAFLDAVIRNLVERDGLLETAVKNNVEVYRTRRTRPV